jgi:hypothetical protein
MQSAAKVISSKKKEKHLQLISVIVVVVDLI